MKIFKDRFSDSFIETHFGIDAVYFKIDDNSVVELDTEKVIQLLAELAKWLAEDV